MTIIISDAFNFSHCWDADNSTAEFETQWLKTVR